MRARRVQLRSLGLSARPARAAAVRRSTQIGVSQGLEPRGDGPLRLRRREPGPHRPRRRLSGDGNTLAVGAPHEASGANGINGNQRDNSVFDAGAVYVFTRARQRLGAAGLRQGVEPADERRVRPLPSRSAPTATRWPSPPYWESSNAKGINGNQKDDSIPQAGAVYVFTRRGAAWSQQAYVKASNTGEAGTADAFGEGDQFGVLAGAERRRQHAGGGRADRRQRGAAASTATRPTTPRSRPAPSTCSRAPARTWSQQAYVKSGEHRRRRPVRLRRWR